MTDAATANPPAGVATTAKRRPLAELTSEEWRFMTAIETASADSARPVTVGDLARQLGLDAAAALTTAATLIAKGVIRAKPGTTFLEPTQGRAIVWGPTLGEGLDPTRMDDYQRLSARTRNATLSEREQQANYALGLVGEAGEVTEKVKKFLFHGHPLDRDGLKKELGDLLWYAAQVATDHGLSLGEIAQANIEKLQGRNGRYRNGFSAQASQEREEGEE